MLHALIWAWLLVLALLAITAAATSYRMPDPHHPGAAARLAHSILIGWCALGFLSLFLRLLWELL